MTITLDLLFPYIPWLGWFLVLTGWVSQRKKVQSWFNTVSVIGFENRVQNSVMIQQSTGTTPPAENTNLERWANWATIAGLVLQLAGMLDLNKVLLP